ncbi:MAG: methyltransferase domain-containing protein, partial [Eggerthellaceae bacterium]|nr:methyltransferase domain-containing protein [Eggerthellaceae bacterium]
EEIREHYANTARTSSCCGTTNSNIYDPELIAFLPADAIKASRGCADPHAFAALQPGESVLDLGSGGGIDSLLAAREVGEAGRVVGIDMTDDMLELARRNAQSGGFSNVEFRKGYIEDLSTADIQDAEFDVVISKCVINLSTDKPAVLREAYRALKPGGRFVVADVVGQKRISEETALKLGNFLGCVSGVLFCEDYEALLREIGFTDVEIVVQNLYCADSLRKRAEVKGYQDLLAGMDIEEAGSASAGCIVIARK